MIRSIDGTGKEEEFSTLLEAKPAHLQAKQGLETSESDNKENENVQFQSTIAKAEVKPLEPWDLYGSKDRADKKLNAAMKKFDERAEDKTVSFRELMLLIHEVRALAAGFTKKVRAESVMIASQGNESNLENMQKKQKEKGSIVTELTGECMKVGASAFFSSSTPEKLELIQKAANFGLTAAGAGSIALSKVMGGQQQVQIQALQARSQVLTSRETAERQAESQNSEGQQANQAFQQFLQSDHDAATKAIGQG